MATPVSIPNAVAKFKTLDKDLSTSVATALWKKSAEVMQYISASVPIGKVIWVRATQDLLPEMPDPKYWKELDGTAVANANSPLNGWVTPDIRGHFLKHPSISETNQTLGGADTRNLTHNHGGVTAAAWNGGAFNADNDDERAGPFWHAHGIDNWVATFDIKPPYRDLRFYIRIV